MTTNHKSISAFPPFPAHTSFAEGTDPAVVFGRAHDKVVAGRRAWVVVPHGEVRVI